LAVNQQETRNKKQVREINYGLAGAEEKKGISAVYFNLIV
jgi:hypothetical protein